MTNCAWPEFFLKNPSSKSSLLFITRKPVKNGFSYVFGSPYCHFEVSGIRTKNTHKNRAFGSLREKIVLTERVTPVVEPAVHYGAGILTHGPLRDTALRLGRRERILIIQRRGWESNPRETYISTAFRVRRLRPSQPPLRCIINKIYFLSLQMNGML